VQDLHGEADVWESAADPVTALTQTVPGVGDATFLYTLFREALNRAELEKWCRELNVDCSVLRGV